MSRDFPNDTSKYLDIGDIAGPDVSGTALTIHCWALLDTNNSQHKLVAKWGGSPGVAQYLLSVTGTGKVEGAIRGSGAYDIATGVTTVSTGVWHSLAMRKNGTGAGALQAFLDGTSDVSTTSNESIQNTGTGLKLGVADDGGAHDGLLAEVAIWNIALSDAEIKLLSKGVSPLMIRPANLKGYWPIFGTGTTHERDYSGSGAHASIVNSLAPGTRVPPVMPFVFESIPGEIGAAGPGVDAALVYLDLQVSSAEVFAGVDSATVYLDLQPSGVDIRELFDSATVYLDLQVLGGECYSTFSATLLGEGEADLRFVSDYELLRWSADANLRFSEGELLFEGINC
jgi:hypothetical protein